MWAKPLEMNTRGRSSPAVRDKLAGEYANSTVLIGDIDCTSTANKKFCGTQGVRGFPTLKYFAGRPDGQKYEGKRDYTALSAFAKLHLGPSCHVDTPELCSADESSPWS